MAGTANDGAAQKEQCFVPYIHVDGTLLDAESLVDEALEVVTRYGTEWDGRGAQKRLGKRPLETSASVVEDCDLPGTPVDINNEVIALLEDRFVRVDGEERGFLLGAIQLVKHLHTRNVPMAIVSRSPAESIKTNLSHQSGWTDNFPVVVAGDIWFRMGSLHLILRRFLEAAKQVNAEPSKCLVIQHASARVLARQAAGMQVVAVPSMPFKDGRPLYSSTDVIMSSLLDFRPELLGLPALNDRIGEVLPMEPWYMGGPVMKGFGGGSKVLGSPTGMSSYFLNLM